MNYGSISEVGEHGWVALMSETDSPGNSRAAIWLFWVKNGCSLETAQLPLHSISQSWWSQSHVCQKLASLNILTAYMWNTSCCCGIPSRKPFYLSAVTVQYKTIHNLMRNTCQLVKMNILSFYQPIRESIRKVVSFANLWCNIFKAFS